MDERVEIEGTIEEIIFSNEVNGYTVCSLVVDKDKEKEAVTAVGYMPFINVGEMLKITGKWVKHPDYGEQLKVEYYEKLLPHGVEAIEKYLSSGIIKGVGPATAKKIVDRFGEETLDIIQFKPEMLTEIRGINHDKAFKIGQAFEEQRELRKVVMFLQEYGISPTYAMKIFKSFGDKTIEEIKSNPYRLADEIFGIGFKTADRIARSMGVDPGSKFRICSGIKYVLSQSAANGHTFVPEDKLREYLIQLLEVNISGINDALISLVMDKAVCLEKNGPVNNVYLSSFFHAELGVCRRLTELICTSPGNDMDEMLARMEEFQKQEGILLAEMQKMAVSEALSNGVMVITGGPGTGKTTIIKSIIHLLDREGYDVALAAPTGRAAKRMTEATGYEAKTIHRLLEIGYMGDGSELVFLRNEANPIEADVVIIDEMSMVDILLMNHLLKAISVGTRLILVGDVNQLPSVGAGNVLRDIIDSGLVKTVKLTDIFRQAEESMIIVNAHRVNRGEKPFLNVKDKDFFFISRNSLDSIVKTVVDLAGRRLPDTYGFTPFKDIQVLTPTRKGQAGVLNLNLELQKVLNPPDKRKNEKVFREFLFREGDRVMQIKNNYNLRWFKEGAQSAEGQGVFNGDTGIITNIDNEEQRITVLFEDDRQVVYEYENMDEIEPAFAITIHKSQGSEFPVVILPVFSGPQVLMTRNLLYTAITRAKGMVVVVGSEKMLYDMVSNTRETQRFSGLAEKIRKYMVMQN